MTTFCIVAKEKGRETLRGCIVGTQEERKKDVVSVILSLMLCASG